MKNNKTYFLIMSLFLLFANNALAQDAQSLFKQVYEELQGDYLYLQYEVWSFAKKDDAKGKMTGKGFFSKEKQRYHTKFMEDEMLIDTKTMLLIDHGQKSIKIFDSPEEELKEKQQQLNITQFLERYEELKIDQPQQGIQRISIQTPEQLIYLTEMWIDASSKKIRKMVYHYQNAQQLGLDAEKMEVQYKKLDTQYNPSNTVPSAQQYITKKNSGYVGKGKWAAYQVLNRTNS